jgi:hypothetical protein
MDMRAMTLIRSLRRVALLAVFSAAILSVVFSGRSLGKELVSESGSTESAIKIKIEVESYYRSHSQCGEAIRPATCAEGCSGGAGVDGVDCAGDWLMFDVNIPEAIIFRDSLRSAGDVGLRRKFSVEFYPQGSWTAQAADTLTTRPGTGIT